MGWKKIIFSGSSAHLSAVTASYFSGDGSALTNLSVSQTATVSSTFTNQTSVAVDHNFDSKNIVVSVYNDSDVQIIPASVTLTSVDRVTITFDSSTSGLIVVAKGGHLVSGSVSADNIDGLDAAVIAALPANTVSGSSFSSPSQGTVRATINGVNTDVDTGLQTGDSPTFASLTLTGDLTVQGTTTTVDSTTIQLGDNIIALNGTAAALGGIHVNDGPASGSLLWDGTNDYWVAGASGSEVKLLRETGDGILSSSAQIAANISGSFTSVSSSLASRISNISTDFADITNKPTLISSSAQVDHDSTTNFVANEHIDHTSVTMTAGNGLTGGGDISSTRTFNVASANNGITINADNIELATASSTFTDGVKSKLDSESVISASAFSSPSQGTVRATINGNNTDVDTGLQTGDSPTFAGLTVNGDLTVTGNTFEAQVSNLNVEDKFIIVNSGSNSGDSGLIFGGSDPAGSGTANQGAAIFWDGTNDIFGFAEDLASNATSATLTSKIGNIETHATSDPSAAPTFQGKGTIYVNESSETIWMYS